MLGNKATKLSRLENGQSSVRPLDIRILYQSLGATVGETERAVETAKLCNQRGRWAGNRSVFFKSFRMAVDLEQDASVINIYHSELVPGLLQTEAYMRSVFTADPDSRLAVDIAMKARLERQEVLTKPDPPQVNFVLSESSVARMVGDETVMRDQLQHLVNIAEWPNVQLQVLPFRARTSPVGSVFMAFQIQTPGEADSLEVVYVEDYDDRRYRLDPESIAWYADLWHRLVEAALDPRDSRGLLLKLVDTY